MEDFDFSPVEYISRHLPEGMGLISCHAAGVFEHSDVRQDLWRRLVHTLRALYLMAYGTKEEAKRAAELVQAVHAQVHGSTRTQLGRFPPGTRYSATDPELMLWVHATLVQASLAAYERFVDPLSREDQ